MATYQISWYVANMGKMQFFVRSSSPPKAGQIQWAFEQWFKKFVEGASKPEKKRYQEQLEKAFEAHRIEKIEVIQLDRERQ